MKIHFQKTKPSLITYRIQKKFGREEMMGDLKTVTETHSLSLVKFTAQKMKFSIKDFYSKCDQICSWFYISMHLANNTYLRANDKPFINGKIFKTIME